MTYSSRNLMLAIAALASVSQAATAVDITIFDASTQYRANSASRQWWGDNSNAVGVQHPDVRGVAEDNETEPGTAIGQQWDLEAFQINGTQLSVIGGFNFMTGQGTYASGDIFIDVDGDAAVSTEIGGGGTTVKSNSLFKYDYVIDFQQTVDRNLDSSVSSIGPRYTVYKLDDTSDSVVSVTLSRNAKSNPWIYYSGGEAVAGYVDRTIAVGTYSGGLYAGWGNNNTHHMITVDLGFLGGSIPDGTMFKFTMECGNDNLVGRYDAVPDGGTTLTLLGGDLALIGAARRAQRRHAAA